MIDSPPYKQDNKKQERPSFVGGKLCFPYYAHFIMNAYVFNILQDRLGKNFWEKKNLQKNVKTLHSFFTEDRGTDFETYLKKEETLDAYFAYFFPVNAQKMVTLFESHFKEVSTLLESKKDSAIHILDLGCGPAATATVAFFERFGDRLLKGKQIVLHLVDHQRGALEYATNFLEEYLTKRNFQFDIEITASDSFRLQKMGHRFDLIFAANVFNEMKLSSQKKLIAAVLEDSLNQKNGLFFIMEPSHRVPSQNLILLRELVLKANKNLQIFGPCLHTEKCPLIGTKHWCHFSEKSQDEEGSDILVEMNLSIFKNPRLWLKFAYLVLGHLEKKPKVVANSFRAIGDLHPSSGRLAIDLCAPKHKKAFILSPTSPKRLQESLLRGSIVILDGTRSKIKEVIPFQK
jgi:SAM-dependent methyltransferase